MSSSSRRALGESYPVVVILKTGTAGTVVGSRWSERSSTSQTTDILPMAIDLFYDSEYATYSTRSLLILESINTEVVKPSQSVLMVII